MTVRRGQEQRGVGDGKLGTAMVSTRARKKEIDLWDAARSAATQRAVSTDARPSGAPNAVLSKSGAAEANAKGMQRAGCTECAGGSLSLIDAAKRRHKHSLRLNCGRDQRWRKATY